MLNGRPSTLLRVLHVVLHLDEGGLERLVIDLVQRTDGSRFDPHVLCLSHFGREAEALNQPARLHLAAPMGPLSMIWPRSLKNQIGELAPDVVHTHSGVWFKGALAARQAGVPRIVHTEHGRQHPDSWSARLVDGLASGRTDVVVAVSHVLGRQLADRVVRIPERIVVVRNGVDTEMLRPASAADTLRADLGLEPDARVIGTVGRFDPIKAYDVLLDAFRLLRVSWLSDSPQPVLVLAGDGPERERLESLARDLGIGDSVRFVGWRDDVPALLAAFDVFTLSSKSEGTSVSLLEAMSMGVCPVVTAVGGNPAVLGDELAHRLVPSGDAQAMADAWVAAFSDEAARRADGMKGRSRVERFYSLDRMVRKYERLYLGEPLEPAYAGATGVERGGR